MPRILSTNLIEQINSVNNADPLLWMMRIYNGLFTEINIVNNNADITSNGVLFTAYGFAVTLENDDDQPAKLKFSLDNVDRSLIDEVRLTEGIIKVDLKLVLASTPDVVEIEYTSLNLRSVQYNKSSISGILSINEIYLNKFPAHNMNPLNYPGLF